jgi:hypothetical protein
MECSRLVLGDPRCCNKEVPKVRGVLPQEEGEKQEVALFLGYLLFQPTQFID